MNTLDEAALNSFLDDHPGDVVTRLALRDLYLEQGRDDEAEGLAWLMEEGKFPHDTGAGTYQPTRWRWYSNDWNGKPNVGGLNPHAWVGHRPCLSLRFRTGHKDRQEAEADLISWARLEGLL